MSPIVLGVGTGFYQIRRNEHIVDWARLMLRELRAYAVQLPRLEVDLFSVVTPLQIQSNSLVEQASVPLVTVEALSVRTRERGRDLYFSVVTGTRYGPKASSLRIRDSLEYPRQNDDRHSWTESTHVIVIAHTQPSQPRTSCLRTPS